MNKSQSTAETFTKNRIVKNCCLSKDPKFKFNNKQINTLLLITYQQTFHNQTFQFKFQF